MTCLPYQAQRAAIATDTRRKLDILYTQKSEAREPERKRARVGDDSVALLEEGEVLLEQVEASSSAALTVHRPYCCVFNAV